MFDGMLSEDLCIKYMPRFAALENNRIRQWERGGACRQRLRSESAVDSHAAIRGVLKRGKYHSALEISKKTGVSNRSIGNVLAVMFRKGLVDRKCDGRVFLYTRVAS